MPDQGRDRIGSDIIALLMPVHNGLEYTRRSIDSIFRSLAGAGSEGRRVRIFVIDDGSVDNTSQWIRDNYPQVLLVPGNGNLWWSGSINAGIREAEKFFSPEHYLLWNNDLVAGKNYFKALFDLLEILDSGTMIASKVFFLNDPDRVFSMGGWYNPVFGVARMINERTCNGVSLEREIDVDWFGGMGTLIPSKVIEVAGFFDEHNFPQYKGDFDFALRARKKGFRIKASPALILFNDTSQTGLVPVDFKSFIQSFYDRKSQNNLKETFAFYRKHANPLFGWYGFIMRYIRHCTKYFFNV